MLIELIKNIFYNFFIIIKNTNKSFEKKHVKDIKTLLEKKKTKSTNMLVSDIEIFLKKKEKRSINMAVNDIRIL